MNSVSGFVLIAGALMGTGCANVSSAMPGMSPATGEAWYSKDTTFFGLPLDSDIYYCSKETPGKCTKALWRDRGDAEWSSGPPAAASTDPGAPAGSPGAPAGSPAGPADSEACQKAQEYAKRVASMSEGTPRDLIKRLADRKAAECEAQKNKAPAP